MSEQTKTVFLSYCHKETELADHIGYFFSSIVGITVSRDTRKVKYRDSFKGYMKGVREHDYVVMLISDNFLKSQACMFEVGEILTDMKFKEKLIFIIVSDDDAKYLKSRPDKPIGAKVHCPFERIKYTRYWEKRYKRLETKIKSIESLSAKIEPSRALREIRKIIDHDLSPFLEHIGDAYGITFDQAYQNKFADICSAMGIAEETYYNQEGENGGTKR